MKRTERRWQLSSTTRRRIEMKLYYSVLKKANNVWTKAVTGTLKAIENTKPVERLEKDFGVKTTLQTVRAFINHSNEVAQNCDSLLEWIDVASDRYTTMFDLRVTATARVAATMARLLMPDEFIKKESYEKTAEEMKRFTEQSYRQSCESKFTEYARQGAELLRL
jgi:hypothetical protein